MSKTKIDLVNSALILVGDNPITSLNDQTTQALVANTVLEDLIEAELLKLDGVLLVRQQQQVLFLA